MQTELKYAPPLQRAIRAMSPRGTPCAWAYEATALERVGLSQYASETLELFGPLSPVEALLAARTAGATSERGLHLLQHVHLNHHDIDVATLQKMCSEKWSLLNDSVWTSYSEGTQLLIMRYAAASLSIVRPEYSGQYKTRDANDVWKKAPLSLQTDPLSQCIVACNNPSLFSMWMSSQPLDPQAAAIGFLQGLCNTRAWYTKMNEASFASLVTPDPDALAMGQHNLVWTLHRNKTLFRFPWEWTPLVVEHNPALFIASALNNRDVANAKSHMDLWLGPALLAVSKHCQQNTSYVSNPWLRDITAKQQMLLETLVKRHFSKGYDLLMVVNDLYKTDTPNGHVNSNKEWFRLLAKMDNANESHTFNLDGAIFQEHAASL